MKYTNKQGLPEPFLNVLINTQRNPSDTYASATALLKSPRQFHLGKRYSNQVTEDVSDNIWAIMGNALHYVLEKGEGKNDLVEQYLTENILGKKVSGMADHYSNNILTDYKTTSVWSIIYKSSYSDWEKQLNIYAYLYHKAGFDVKKIQVTAILRDWQKSKAQYDKSYPQSQVIVVELPLWDTDKQLKYIEDRIKLFTETEYMKDDHLPICTDEERWYTGDKWAVKKIGNKRAIKLHTSKESAEGALKDGQEIEYRKGESKKCDYCMASDFCNQYKESLK